MDQVLDQLLQKETVYLSFVIVILTFFIRRIVETAVPSVKTKHSTATGVVYQTKFGLWWNSVILYIIPVAVGSVTAMLAFGSYLPEEVKTRGGAAVWGGIIGWCSSFLYKVLRKSLLKKTGIDLNPTVEDPTEALRVVTEVVEAATAPEAPQEEEKPSEAPQEAPEGSVDESLGDTAPDKLLPETDAPPREDPPTTA